MHGEEVTMEMQSEEVSMDTSDVTKIETREAEPMDIAANEPPMDGNNGDDVAEDTLWLSDLTVNNEEEVPLENLSFGFGNFDLGVRELDCYVAGEVLPIAADVQDVAGEGHNKARDVVIVGEQVADAEREVKAVGLQAAPHPELLQASKGKEKSPSKHNDKWALRRVDQLRASLGWDMKKSFGNLPLDQIDERLSNLFARVVKVTGEEYPAASLMNMLGGFNRMIRRASDLRLLRGIKSPPPMGKEFNIKKHENFVKTRLVLGAALKKTAREGTNKKTSKVEIMTEAMEEAILVDVDHQITDNQGCQKRLVLYLVVRCGIRGGKELHQLRRDDLVVGTDSSGRKFVRFNKHHSKSNAYTLDRYAKHQFRKPYISYEPGFVMCAKQYLRHMPPLENCEPDLLLQPIPHPAGIIWFNRVQKVGRDKCKGYLKNMATLVGICPDVFSNKSGRATLITRMAARGVPDEVGMLMSGHHTTDGYLRYDRSQAVKMEAAALVASDPSYNYQALAEVSKKFVEDKVVGDTANYNPLVAPGMPYGSSSGVLQPTSSNEVTSAMSTNIGLSKSIGSTTLTERFTGKAVAISMSHDVQATSGAQHITVCGNERQVTLANNEQQLTAWHGNYDKIDWEAKMKNNPVLWKALGGLGGAGGSQVAVGSRIGSSLAGKSFHLSANCVINFICGKNDDDKENNPGK